MTNQTQLRPRWAVGRQLSTGADDARRASRFSPEFPDNPEKPFSTISNPPNRQIWMKTNSLRLFRRAFTFFWFGITCTGWFRSRTAGRVTPSPATTSMRWNLGSKKPNNPLYCWENLFVCIKKKKEKTIQPMCSGNADQREKLQMWCRDAAENADFQASYVMRTVRLGSEAGALQESSMDASVCVRAWAWRGGDTAGLGGKAPGRESFLGWKRQVSDTGSTPLPTLCLTFVVKWWIYIWFSVLLYYWSHGGSMGSIPIKVRRLNSWHKIKVLFWELAQKLLHKCCQICIKTNQQRRETKNRWG